MIILEWIAISYSRHLPDAGIRPESVVSPALATKFFATAPPRKPRVKITWWVISMDEEWAKFSLIRAPLTYQDPA